MSKDLIANSKLRLIRRTDPSITFEGKSGLQFPPFQIKRPNNPIPKHPGRPLKEILDDIQT